MAQLHGSDCAIQSVVNRLAGTGVPSFVLPNGLAISCERSTSPGGRDRKELDPRVRSIIQPSTALVNFTVVLDRAVTALRFLTEQMTIEALRCVQEILGNPIVVCLVV